ncbi:FAD-binding oxidoreductase [Actinomadura rudentiformis]|uniref:FAD-binding oxidoreductase n=2 Tax=Actinomadura rudentiformis TaxID=359158 RepID=A0A6H9YU97_9ACTN|nr:FAD-binding oxidoreductase [Actinomadura rudentiformis]
MTAVTGFTLDGEIEEPVPPDAVRLPPPRVAPPPLPFCTAEPYERITHTYGKAYRDLMRAFRGRFDNPPDFVARPRDEHDLIRVLEWAENSGVAVVPYGGGTSVVGGVEPRDLGPSVSLDLTRLDRVLEVDEVSLAARIQAGMLGPDIDRHLVAHGLTLRHFPQSYELSTLGGWIATRAGGHFATLATHIDDLVESIRAITPRGVWESRRVPGSGAGVSPDRMLLGSEGALGVITEAWVRVRPRPAHRASAAVRFPSFGRGAEAVRTISQAGLHPSNCRLLDPAEARLTSGGDGTYALLMLGFEAADHPVDAWMDRGLELARSHGGTWDEVRPGGGGQGGAWKDTFLRMPYLRNAYPAIGLVAETFETAVTWDRFAAFHAAVTGAVRDALGGTGIVTCRFAFTYPDGPAPYFTVLARARRGDEVAQWDEIKRAAGEAVLTAGGTITHHHAVGRDHRPWYDRQRPDPFAAALRGAKDAVDPAGILNPGVLV